MDLKLLPETVADRVHAHGVVFEKFEACLTQLLFYAYTGPSSNDDVVRCVAKRFTHLTFIPMECGDDPIGAGFYTDSKLGLRRVSDYGRLCTTCGREFHGRTEDHANWHCTDAKRKWFLSAKRESVDRIFHSSLKSLYKYGE